MYSLLSPKDIGQQHLSKAMEGQRQQLARSCCRATQNPTPNRRVAKETVAIRHLNLDKHCLIQAINMSITLKDPLRKGIEIKARFS